MKPLLVMMVLFGGALAPAAESGEPKESPPAGRCSAAPRAWLGLAVTKPDETITAQLPSLPPGIGFVVRAVEQGGPAEAAGLKNFDVLWKLGDQWLVNECQLAALLRLSKPGDEITLSGFRAGQPLEVKIHLGEAPARKRSIAGDLVEDTLLPPGACHGPMRVVNVAEKLASYSTEEGRLEVRKQGENYQVKIQGPGDEVIYTGEIPGDGTLDAVPEAWRRRVQALRRGLDHALSGATMPLRQPRPRVVPPPVVQ